METKKFVKWSQEEDERLLSLISENRSNLQEAFRRFHEEFPNRTIRAITYRWYGILRLRNDTNVCMLSVNKTESCQQEDISHGEISAYTKGKVSIWEKYILWVKGLLNSLIR